MTPLIKLNNFYLKREDQNPTGSAKDRAVKLQVDNLVKLGFKSAVISSTGNAAISAQYYCSIQNIPLTIFTSPQLHPDKAKLIHQSPVITSLKPISDAFKYAKKNQAYFLRQSTDPIALLGYQEIAVELISQLPQITSIFIPVGSGTTLLGISQKLPQNVKIFAVQPASNCPIAKHFDTTYISETSSITDALTVKMLPLKNQVIQAISQSQGFGIVVQNQEVIDTQKYLIDHQINTSPESALALSGYFKANTLYDPGAYSVILLTGAARL
jgi:threonine synthase